RLRYADMRQYRRRWRSECVIASAIGDRRHAQFQSLWYGDWRYRRGLLASCQHIEDHVGVGDSGRERLRAGSFPGLQSVGQDGGQHLHHLPIAIVAARQLGADLVEGSRQGPIFEWSAVPERARLARQHRHVVPGIIRNLVAPEPPRVLANDNAVLLNHNAIGIGVHVDRPANRLRGHRVLVVVEAYEARLRHRDTRRMEAVEWPPIARQVRALGLENLKDRLVLLLGMKLRLGVGDALLEKIGVEILIGVEFVPWLEQPFGTRPTLALSLPFPPARRRRAGGGLDEVMAHQLLEAQVELSLFADKHGVNRRTHVVVDAAQAAPLEKLERLL